MIELSNLGKDFFINLGVIKKYQCLVARAIGAENPVRSGRGWELQVLRPEEIVGIS
jgi:hypothetical protein